MPHVNHVEEVAQISIADPLLVATTVVVALPSIVSDPSQVTDMLYDAAYPY
jgi:hypothetical protein